MSARIHKSDQSVLPLILSALLGLLLALVSCSLLSVAVYRGAIGERVSHVLSLLCPVFGSAAAAFRCFSKTESALLKKALLLLLFLMALYLPLLLVFSNGLLSGKEGLSLFLRCLVGILLGCPGAVKKRYKISRPSRKTSFNARRRKQ